MPKTIVKIDLNESPYKNDMIHNRWHPDVPIIEWVKPGEDFIMETYDWTGGFIKNNKSADDVRDIDLIDRALSVAGRSASTAPSRAISWWSTFSTSARCRTAHGVSTASSPRRTAAAFSPTISRWRRSRSGTFPGCYTHSRHVPGVSFAGLVHPGLIGCLPDQKMLETWNAREQALIDTNPTRVPPLANPPFAATAHAAAPTAT